MDADIARRATKWILNSTLDVDKIATYLNITGADKVKLKATAITLRAEQEKNRM